MTRSNPPTSPAWWTRPIRLNPRQTKIACIILIPLALVLWQCSFHLARRQLEDRWALRASVGLSFEMRQFFYFYYYLDQFPVGAMPPGPAGADAESARQFVAQHGNQLRMDLGSGATVRGGDYGRVLLFLPAAWLGGNAGNPTPTAFNIILFVSSLLALLLAFWRIGHPVLGIILVVLLGSNPFQLHETYVIDNLFSLPISTAILILALHARYLTDDAKIDALAWATAIVSGLMLATLHQIRAEAIMIAAAIPLAYLTIRNSRWIARIGLVAALLFSYLITAQSWNGYWDRKFAAAQKFVAAAGGQAYYGPHSHSHVFWHSLYCGLGDFGKDRGFQWNDRAAFAYATPILQSKYNLHLTYNGGYYFNETYDGISHIYPPDLPEYNRVMRDAVLHAVADHPFWYAGVLAKRFWRIFARTSPLSLALGPWRVGIPGAGFLVIPLLIVLIIRRKIFLAKLIAFTLPLGLTSLLVYSGNGTTYYGICHILAAGILLYLLIRWWTQAPA